MNGARGKNSHKQIEMEERRSKALELRKNGANFAQIGRSLGITASRAHQLVRDSLARIAKMSDDTTEELRQLEIERLDGMLLAIATQIGKGNFGAIDRGLRIAERRSKLLGLDAPTRQEIAGEIQILKGYLTKDASPDAWEDDVAEG